jgi:hypothetical protein
VFVCGEFDVFGSIVVVSVGVRGVDEEIGEVNGDEGVSDGNEVNVVGGGEVVVDVEIDVDEVEGAFGAEDEDETGEGGGNSNISTTLKN